MQELFVRTSRGIRRICGIESTDIILRELLQSCPFLGKPAFEPGNEKVVLSLGGLDDI
eukprot:gene24322-26079_t